MKYSWQRQIILETIQEHKEHLSAQQIYGYARERCPHISLGTVYRNLNTLADNDMIFAFLFMKLNICHIKPAYRS